MKDITFSGNFGLERETLRVDSSGKLAQTPHPFGNDEHITRDFCENQIELITPVCQSIEEAVSELEKLDKKAADTLAEKGERIWLYSNPPHIESEDDIPIANFTGAQSAKQDYRMALQMRYGKRLMLLSGVHFNFSFSHEQLFEMSGGDPDRAFTDALYLRLYKQLMRHSWLLVLLTGASAYYDRSFDEDGADGVIESIYSSVRNSKRGYFNQFIPVLDHKSIESFCISIDEYIKKGLLFSASELYLPIRMKPKGANSLDALRENGVDHIELRMFDLDPRSPLGINERDLKFAHLLMIYLLTLPDLDFTEEMQCKAIRTHQSAALIDPDKELIEKAQTILSQMTAYYSDNEKAKEIIKYEQDKLHKAHKERYENYYGR